MQHQDILSKQSEIINESLKELQEKFLKASSESPELMISADFRRKLADNFFIDHSGKKENMKEINNFYIKSVYDNHQIPVRLYIPQIAKENKVIMFTHGGGWIQGNLETHDYLCRKIANILQIKVLAIDYRLATENPFPIPLNDVFSVYSWCDKNQEYNDIIISGDSAGGNLCAALCIKLSELKYIKKPCEQLLFYPALSNTFQSSSFEVFKDITALPKLGALFFYSQYVGKSCLDTDILNNKLVYPILEDNMSIFPKTTVISAGCDVLLDENLQFIKKLKNSEVEAEHIIVEGAVHGFMTYGKEFEEEITKILKNLHN